MREDRLIGSLGTMMPYELNGGSLRRSRRLKRLELLNYPHIWLFSYFESKSFRSSGETPKTYATLQPAYLVIGPQDEQAGPKRKKEKRRRHRSARMSKDKQQDSVNLADLGAGRPLLRNPLSSLRSLSLTLYMFSYFCMILTPDPDRCAALSEEDRAGLVNALKLQSLAGKHTDVLETLSPAVRKRVDVLREIQSQHDELEAKFFEERAALEAKYQKLYEPMYSKVYD
ncbi:hypothetical protein B296_00038614 [Ensete ventricosum]|uniref:Uncharacterized protein n=1 Tax=Ensete ventricosum TaxID=4639 RepID=A0A426YBS3_ENSVE|nr:hypothetical protein B296_00038614 [Ensete ventricosum]